MQLYQKIVRLFVLQWDGDFSLRVGWRENGVSGVVYSSFKAAGNVSGELFLKVVFGACIFSKMMVIQSVYIT